MALECVSFSYTGDGQDNRVLNLATLSGQVFTWTPQLVFIKASAATSQLIYRHAGMAAGESFQTNTAGAVTTGIKSFGANSVTIGTGANVNTDTGTYNGVAFRSGNGSHLRTGSYTGDGNDDRSVSISDTWTPSLVFVQRGATSVTIHRTAEHVDGGSGPFTATGDTTDHIQAFGAGTFQVGTSTNVNGTSGNTTYYWFAMRDDSNVFETFGYTGNGSDDRNLTALTFTPNAMVLVKVDGNFSAVVRFGGHVGDSSQVVDAASTINLIQGFITNGIQLGTANNANVNTGVFTGWAASTFIAPGGGNSGGGGQGGKGNGGGQGGGGGGGGNNGGPGNKPPPGQLKRSVFGQQRSRRRHGILG